MANKRMFTKRITDSDAFLDMPKSSQALYFHLNMHADDDGFINNPKKIQRWIGASEDDLKLLIAKRFLLTFENGVIVIKHWRMHNTIRKDRYTPTQYQEELRSLALKDNQAYTDDIAEALENGWQPANSKRLPDGCQVVAKRLPDGSPDGTTDIGLDSDKDIGLDSDKEIERIDYQKIADMYNEICISFPRLQKLSDGRKKAIAARIHSGYSMEDLRLLFEKAEASTFLKGGNDRNWSATFDWLLKDSNIAKVLDGNYDDKQGGAGQAAADQKQAGSNPFLRMLKERGEI